MLAFVMAALFGVPQFAPGATTPQTIPSIFEDRVLIQATVNGRPLWFHLDTGANGMFIDRNVAVASGLTPASDGSVTADVTIGSLRATNAQFHTISAYGFASGVTIVGLIGTPLLESGIFTIDFVKKQVLFYPPGSFDPSSAGVAPTPIDFDGHVTRVHAWFASTRATMLLDTGAQISMLFQPFANDVTLGGPVTDPASITVGYGMKPTTERQYHVKPLTFGGLRVRDPVIDVVDQAPPILPTTLFDGVLGRDVLRFFRMTLDYADQVGYFDPRGGKTVDP
jgi:hypothetical protein